MTNATAKATIHTNYGDIVVELFGNHAPLTVENFIGLADGSRQWKHPRTGEIMNTPPYKDVVFHRIIKNFMNHGGDPLGMGVGGPGYQFKDEIHPELSFSKPYLLAMANARSEERRVGKEWRTRGARGQLKKKKKKMEAGKREAVN